MRSIKDIGIEIDGYRLYPGSIYLLKFLNRDYRSEYIFEFDSVIRYGDSLRIYHRNKWFSEGIVNVCNAPEALVTLPSCEDLRISRYNKVIDWDNI